MTHVDRFTERSLQRKTCLDGHLGAHLWKMRSFGTEPLPHTGLRTFSLSVMALAVSRGDPQIPIPILQLLWEDPNIPAVELGLGSAVR